MALSFLLSLLSLWPGALYAVFRLLGNKSEDPDLCMAISNTSEILREMWSMNNNGSDAMYHCHESLFVTNKLLKASSPNYEALSRLKLNACEVSASKQFILVLL